MKIRLVLSACLLVLISGCQTAAPPEEFVYDGRFSFVMSDMPRFEDFPDVDLPEMLAEDIDWDSHPKAWTFRTRLREGLKKGPNFAGKYAVVTHGCGSPCQVNWIVNTETGKVIGNIGSAHGVSYRLDSRMLVKHMPYAADLPYTSLGTFGTIDYYLIADDKLHELLKLHPPTIESDNPYYPAR